VCHQGCNRRRPWTGSVDPAGMVFTLDALHTNRRTAPLIYPGVARALGGDPHREPAARARSRARRADGRERRLGWRSVRSRTVVPDRRSIRTAPADDSRVPGARQVFPHPPRRRRPRQPLDHQRNRVRDRQSARQPEHLWLLRTATLDRGKSSPLDPRCDLPRELSPAQDQYRSSSSRQLPQLGDQHLPSRGTRQHRRCQTRPPQPRRRCHGLRI
jgi:hypothetical protein